MHEYVALLQDMKSPLDTPASLDNSLEALKNQLKQLEVRIGKSICLLWMVVQ